MNTTLILDIESEPLPLEQLTAMMPCFEPDARLKDPEKILADLEKQKNAFIDRAALSAATGRILCIGLGNGTDAAAILQGEEDEMLEAFWRTFLPSTTYIGHNLIDFDLPFMIRRSWILGIKLPRLFNGRYLETCFQDTMKTWGCGVYGEKISLNTLAKALGVGEKSGSGKDFAKLYRSSPEGKEAALAYLTNWLETIDAALNGVRWINQCQPVQLSTWHIAKGARLTH